MGDGNMDILGRIKTAIPFKRNSELCRQTMRKVIQAHKEHFSQIDPSDTRKLFKSMDDLHQQLLVYIMLLDQLRKNLQLTYPREDIIDKYKTNKKLPLLRDGISNIYQQYYNIIMKLNNELIKELKQIEKTLGVFVKNKEFYDKIKKEFNWFKKEIEKIKTSDEKAYEYIVEMLNPSGDNKEDESILGLLDTYDDIMTRPEIVGDYSAMLGVLKLLIDLSNLYNKLKTIGTNFSNNTKIKVISIRNCDKHICTIIENGISAVQGTISDFFDYILNEIPTNINNEGFDSPLESLIKMYAKARVALLYIADLDKREDLENIFKNYFNKKYKDLPSDVRKQIKEILDKNNIDISTFKRLWNEFVYGVEFNLFTTNEKDIVKVSI